MKLELLVFAITIFFVLNTYYDGKYLNILKTFKKYYQMIGIAFAGLSAYLFLRKYPSQSKGLVSSASGIIKHLPIDKEAGNIFGSILDMTKEKQFGSHSINPKGVKRMLNSGNGNNMMGMGIGMEMGMGNVMGMNGNGIGNGNKNKRSVSETKKKYVAAQQGWKCGSCQNQLSAWFEVDHKIRLENGGSNNVENLVALCRECHGKKTAFEKF